MIGWLFVVSCLGLPPDVAVLVIPSDVESTSMVFQIKQGQEPSHDAWTTFVRRWHARFDVNHDDRIDPDEALAVPELPNANGSLVALSLAQADTNADGGVSLKELTDYYSERGLSGRPITVMADDAAGIQLGDVLWRLLDRDQDQRLSLEELNAVPALLNRFDRNEDERLVPEEIMTGLTTKQSDPSAAVRWSTDPTVSPDQLQIPLRLDQIVEGKLTSTVEGTQKSPEMERLADGRLRIDRRTVSVAIELNEGSAQRIVAAQQYLLGEISTARGNDVELTFSQVRSEPTLEWMTPMLAAIDTDCNQRIGDAEIHDLVLLLAEGVASQVRLIVVQRGRNLFDALDQNADHQLDMRELTTAGKRLGDHPATGEGLRRDQVRTNLVLQVKRGPVNDRFARLRMPRKQAERTTSKGSVADVVRWFSAMDRNHDGTVSAAEFLGSAARFAQLDANSDGVIDVNEIPAAKKTTSDCL